MPYLLSGAAIAAAIAAGAWALAAADRAATLERGYAELAAVAQLKAGSISAWLDDGKRDVEVFTTGMLRDLLPAVLSGSSEAERTMSRRLGEIVRAKGLRTAAVVAEAAGGPRAVFAGEALPAAVLSWATGPGDAAAFGDLREASYGEAIDFRSVIPPQPGAGRAALVFAFDPDRYLFPLVEGWPGESGSAETIIAQRRGDAVVFLNKPRFSMAPPLTEVHPLSEAGTPLVRAALGARGIDQGRDYRGREVVADLRGVEGADWLLEAKQDASELFAESDLRVRLYVLSSILAVLLTAAFMVTLYFRRRKNLLQVIIAEKEAREALDEELRATLYGIGDGVICAGRDGRVTRMNPESERLTGWGEAEARGRPLDEVFAIRKEDTDEPAESPFRRVMETGTVVGIANHTVLVSREGLARPVSDSGAPIALPSGEVRGVVIVFRDQTEERLARRRLEESESRLRAFIDKSIDGITITDSDGIIAVWNEAQAEVTGITAEQALGRPIWEVQERLAMRGPDPAAEEKLKRDIMAMLRAGAFPSRDKPTSVEFRRQDGERRIMQSRIFMIEQGGLKRFASINRDVTEEMRRERALAESAEELRKAQSQAKLGSWKWIIKEGRVEWSEEMYGIFGVEKAFFAGDLAETIARTIHPDDRAAVDASNRSVVERGVPVPLEYRLIMPDGSQKTVYAEAGRLERDGEGRPAVLYGIVQDVTERKAAEARLAAALEERETLLRELYHRTKNNMQVIISFLSLQSAGMEGRPKEAFLEMMNRIEAMALVHQMLYKSMNLTEIDLGEYLRDLTRLIMDSYSNLADRVSLALDLEAAAAPIDAALPCGLIVNELITNSLKYAFPGGARGRIAVSLRGEGGTTLKLEVADDGAGPPAGFAPRKCRTLGLSSVILIAEKQLQGNAEFRLDRGFACTVRFDAGIFSRRIG